VNRDRAERHLRLAAEAGLRRGRALSDYGAAPGGAAFFTDGILRLSSVAMALTTVGALEAELADDILIQFQAALAVRRRLQPQTGAGPLLLRRPRQLVPAGAAPPPRPARPPAPAAPWRLWPVRRMLPFRDDFVAGELYVLSLLVTADRAQALVFAPLRPAIAGSAGFTGFPEPFARITAADDRGTAYQVNFRGGGTVTQWEGQLVIDPPPPAGARWLELSTGPDAPRLRIDLTAGPPVSDVTVQPQDSQPGEQLLEHAAQQILASSAGHPGDTRRQAYGLGDVVAALEAAGALSPFSPVPGYLAMICERLGIGNHDITAAPTADLPGPWLSMLAWYGRRHRPPVHDGTAAVSTVLPDVDGARVALGGLHTRNNETFLHLMVAPDPSAGPSDGPLTDAGPFSHPGFSCWLRDETRQWHVAVPGRWQGDGDGEVTGTLRVLPPLGRDSGGVTLLASTLHSRVRAEVPLRWWAAP
jgi:hypothetical protein